MSFNKNVFFFFLVLKLDIIDINQIDNNAVKLSWKINETIENSVKSIQIQYRSIHPKTFWLSSNEYYNRTNNYGILQNLQQDQTYKFRLIGFDNNGKQLVISAAKRYTLELIQNQLNSPVPQITDAWITNDRFITLKWQVSKRAMPFNVMVSYAAISLSVEVIIYHRKKRRRESILGKEMTI